MWHVGNHRKRQVISLIEHAYGTLPPDVVRADGTLDLYSDVQRRFEITYRRQQQQLAIRSGGWIGHIPINDRYALDIRARVPVNNLERVLARSGDARIERLEKYYRRYGHTRYTEGSLRRSRRPVRYGARCRLAGRCRQGLRA